MGSVESQPAADPPLFVEEWRKIPWGAGNSNLQYVNNYYPNKDEIQQLRILLLGPAGAGKSSFINTVDTTLQGRMAGRAEEYDLIGDGFTTRYKTYKIQKGARGDFYPFALCDTMGFESHNRGIRVDDIKQVLKGHVTDGYKFKPDSPITENDHGYNSTPCLNDQVHVLVYVISATTSHLLHGEVLKKMREVRLAAMNMGIPQLAILTRIDETYLEFQTNVRNVYKSRFVKRQMEELSGSLGIPVRHIFPVKNYHSEISTDDNIGALVLSALRQIIDFGEDYVNNL